MSTIVLSLLVDNQAGVLSRVSGLFSRRGYNIDSLTVGETENPSYSRMTVVADGEPEVLEQIEKQLAKLVDVVEITNLTPDKSVTRELVLVKVSADNENRHKVTEIADIFRAKIVDVSENSIMMELTGNMAKIEAFISLLKPFTLLQLVRTGVTGLLRGSADDL
ncbi:MAG: acetolactate synthase small subunit [Lachnospiraceae bacterium]|nr:acetolactate synthase small subunit [Lachnospiraceae bacterium]